MERSPRYTSFTRLPHTHDPTRTLVAWFTHPAGAIVQMTRACELTVEMAKWLVEEGCTELLAHFPGSTPLLIVLDLRLMTGRQPAVRGLLVEAAKKLGPRLGQGYVIPPENAGKVYLASLHAAAAALRAFGARVEIAQSLSALMAAKEIRVVG